jgi:hypothetical protein
MDFSLFRGSLAMIQIMNIGINGIKHFRRERMNFQTLPAIICVIILYSFTQIPERYNRHVKKIDVDLKKYPHK